MKEYEIIIETINPCGGTKHAQNEIIEAEAESPEAYVKEHGIFPVMDVSKNTSGDIIITTGDSKGYIVLDYDQLMDLSSDEYFIDELI